MVILGRIPSIPQVIFGVILGQNTLGVMGAVIFGCIKWKTLEVAPTVMEFVEQLSDSLSPEESRKLFVTLTELFANIVADPTKRENLFLPPHAASAVKNPVAYQLLRGENLTSPRPFTQRYLTLPHN